MIKKLILYLLLNCLVISTYAIEHNKPCNFSGKIISDQGTPKLQIVFFENYITGFGNEFLPRNIPVSKNGLFQFSIPKIDHPGRLLIQDIVSGSVFCDFQIVNPGDNIYVKIDIRNNKVNIKFSGKGSAKYECINLISQINQDTIYQEKNINKRIKLADSIMLLKYGILERYKSRISPNIVQIIKADVSGDIENLVIGPLIISETVPYEEKVRAKGEFDIYNQTANGKLSFSDYNLTLSPKYIRFLYTKIKLELGFDNLDKEFEFKDIYNKIRRNYSGVLRERLLCFCILNPDVQYTLQCSDPNEYTACLKDAVSLIKTRAYHKIIHQELITRGKGSKAFDFEFAADSPGKQVHLSDFNGKVVLIDMWGYICTGCYLFTNAFHEKIYPEFKDNPNFKVISIMTNGTKDQYLKRLRRESKPYYTFADYINLYGAGSPATMEYIIKYYNISAMPFLLLIDKKGNIYSSTIFIDGDKPDKIELLRSTIEKALAEPAIIRNE